MSIHFFFSAKEKLSKNINPEKYFPSKSHMSNSKIYFSLHDIIEHISYVYLYTCHIWNDFCRLCIKFFRLFSVTFHTGISKSWRSFFSSRNSWVIDSLVWFLCRHITWVKPFLSSEIELRFFVYDKERRIIYEAATLLLLSFLSIEFRVGINIFAVFFFSLQWNWILSKLLPFHLTVARRQISYTVFVLPM